jgi:hypothetical protein
LDDRGFRIDVSCERINLPNSPFYLCVAICRSTKYADVDNPLWRQLGVDSNLIDDLLSLSYQETKQYLNEIKQYCKDILLELNDNGFKTVVEVGRSINIPRDEYCRIYIRRSRIYTWNVGMLFSFWKRLIYTI